MKAGDDRKYMMMGNDSSPVPLTRLVLNLSQSDQLYDKPKWGVCGGVDFSLISMSMKEKRESFFSLITEICH